jgi:hypothetical protein
VNRRVPASGGRQRETEGNAGGFAALDGRLFDGLDFCRQAYDLFDQVRRSPDGVKNLRLRPSKLEKRLIEELLPIARYVQARYREGRRIKVRWRSGSQPYDAVLWSWGAIVRHGMAPRRLLVEVTTAVHQNEHLARRLLQEQGGSFGVKGITRDATGQIVSKPHVHVNDEITTDLASQVAACIRNKADKGYPFGTALIVQCVANSLTLESEFADAVDRVRAMHIHHAFREVFIFESISLTSATLYGRREERRQRARKSGVPRR